MRFNGGGEQSRGLNVVGIILGRAGGDDEELGWYEVKFRGQGEESGVERRFGLGLFEYFAVMEIGVGEDATEATG